MNEFKTSYVAVYGKNQIPFPSIELLRQYFDNSGNLFDAIMNEVKFYEVNVKPINPFENA